MKNAKDANYSTPDLYLTAFLRTAGCIQDGHERGDDRRTYFIFEPNTDIPRLRAYFYNGKAKVCPLTYANNIRTLKSILHMDSKEG